MNRFFGMSDRLKKQRSWTAVGVLVCIALFLLPTTGLVSELITCGLLISSARWAQLLLGRSRDQQPSANRPQASSARVRLASFWPLLGIGVWTLGGRFVIGPNDDRLIPYQALVEVPVPVVVRWDSGADTLILPFTYLYLPPGTTRYEFAIRGRVVQGVVENRDPAREWYMRIGRDGIVIHD